MEKRGLVCVTRRKHMYVHEKAASHLATCWRKKKENHFKKVKKKRGWKNISTHNTPHIDTLYLWGLYKFGRGGGGGVGHSYLWCGI
jgi:hypothetical protein